MNAKLTLAAASALIVTGCANLNEPMAAGQDSFAKVNFDAQVVDATPAEGAPMMDADMSAAAVERYKTGNAKTGEESEGNSFTAILTPAQ